MAIYQNSYAALELGAANYWTHRQKFQWMSMLFMGCMYLYAARMAMPITVTKISTEYGWTKTTSGTVLCCFFWGYALTQVLGGYLGDVWGGDKVMLGAAIGWSLLTLYTPECVAWSRGALLLNRILLGAFQGLHFPAMSSIIVSQLRQQDRTIFTSVVAAGPSCGVILLAHFTENNSYFILISWLPTYFHERFPDAKALCQLSKALLLPLVPWCSYTWALLCVSLAVACSGFHNSGVFINPQDIAPLHAGSVFGFLGVYLAGYVVDATRSWSLIFYLTSLLNLVGCAAFLVFGRGQPILAAQPSLC
ncbi:hypothetical protein MRX96_017604 [Rhipicephalus microplus]